MGRAEGPAHRFVKVEQIGDPTKISVGAARMTSNPRELLIARLAAEVMEHSGLFEDGFSLQTGTGGSATATARFLEQRMVRKGIKASFALGGITGSIGLAPTLAALATGSTLALANKESLVAGGPLVKAAAAPGQLVPVDSEHSALAQCLRGGRAAEVRRLVLTASGGPFRGRRRDQLTDVSPAQALAHPTWDMGKVVTTNSATLVNKGLEVIEAHLLFDVPYACIDVVVHPQSHVHSMVEFVDGSTLAQASPPDMRLPIALGLAWPDRVPYAAAGCDWSAATSWSFEPLDTEAFPAVGLARRAGEAGGCAPAVFNAANEECVEAFHAGALTFLGIVDTLERVLATYLAQGVRNPRDVADVHEAEAWARAHARERIGVAA